MITALYQLIKIRSIESAFKRIGLPFVMDEYDALYEDDKYDDNTILYYPAAETYVMSLLGTLYLMYPNKGDPTQTSDTQLRTSQRNYDSIVYQCVNDKQEEWFRTFHEIAAAHLPHSVCYFDLSATLISEHDLQLREEHVKMKTFMISHHEPKSTSTNAKKLVLDPYIAYRLCNAQLNLSYLRKQLEATPNADVLLVLAYAQNKLVGIRAVRLSTATKNPSMQGVYACGKGYGALLQTHTETILQTALEQRLRNRPLFTLNSLTTAKGFWERMGFIQSKMTNVRDPTASRMTKNIFSTIKSSSSSTSSTTSTGPKAKKVRINT